MRPNPVFQTLCQTLCRTLSPALCRIPFVVILILGTSCATIRGTHQRIKVKSHPPGAKVLYQGSEIGTTPGFMDIPRGRSGQISLLFPNGKTLEQPLNSSYRWGDTF